jgi:hypothetical protein
VSGAYDLSEVISEDDRFLRRTLLRLVATEASEDRDQAAATLKEALDRSPDRTAFRIAEAYLKSK